MDWEVFAMPLPKVTPLVPGPPATIMHAMYTKGALRPEDVKKYTVLTVSSDDKDVDVHDAVPAIKKMPEVERVKCQFKHETSFLHVWLKKPLEVGDAELSLVTSALGAIVRALKPTD